MDLAINENSDTMTTQQDIIKLDFNTRKYIALSLAIIKIYGYGQPFSQIKNELRSKLNLKIKILENLKIRKNLESKKVSTAKNENVQIAQEIDKNKIPAKQTLSYQSDIEVKREVEETLIKNIQPSISINVDDSVIKSSTLTMNNALTREKCTEFNQKNEIECIKVEKLHDQEASMNQNETSKIQVQNLVQNNCRMGPRLTSPLKLLNLEYGNINTILSFNVKNELVQTVLKNLKFNDFLSFFKIFAWINQNPISPFEYDSTYKTKHKKDFIINTHHSIFQKDQINKLLFEIIVQLLNTFFEQFENEKSLGIIDKKKFQFDFMNNSKYRIKANIVELVHDEFFRTIINLIKFKEFNLYSHRFKHSLNDSYFKFEKELHVFKKFVIGYYYYSRSSTKPAPDFPTHTLFKIIKSKFDVLEFEILSYFKYLRFDEKNKSYLTKNSKKFFVKNYHKRKNLLNSVDYASKFQKSKNSNIKLLVKFLDSNPLLGNKMITKICFKNLKFLIDCEFQILRFLINDVIIEKNLLQNQKCYQQHVQHLKSCKTNMLSYLITLNDPRLLINFNLIKWNQLSNT